MEQVAQIYAPAKKLSLKFNGGLSFELIDSIVGVISRRLDAIEEDVNIRKKVFGVVMECLQNLGNHIEAPECEEVYYDYDPASVGFMLDLVDEGYRVATVNFVANNKVEDLKKRISHIKDLTVDELKKKYNEVLLSETFSEKGGGGLGLIDIALRSGGKIDCFFQPFNEEFSLFSFHTLIKK